MSTTSQFPADGPPARSPLWPRTIRPWLRATLSRAIPARKSSSITQQLTQANLPPSITKLLKQTLKLTRLPRHEQQDIAAELIAHFQDGLAAGKSESDLITTFGDPASAAILLRSSTMNKRTPLQKFTRRLGQGILIAVGLLIATYLIALLIFTTGKPTIATPFALNYNKELQALPQDQLAYPLYVQVIEQIKRPPQSLIEDPQFATPEAKAAFEAKRAEDSTYDSYPQVATDPRFPQVKAWLSSHESALTLLHQASKLPRAGVPFFKDNPRPPANPSSVVGDSQGFRYFHPADYQAIESDDVQMVEVLLPFLAEFRNFARYSLLDARIAIEDKNLPRLMRALETQLGIIRHAREDLTIIGQLVSLAIVELHHNTLEEAIASRILDEQSLQSLVQQRTTLETLALTPTFTREREMFLDFLQRAFTDDGSGGGRMTKDGLLLLERYTKLTPGDANPSNITTTALGPFTFIAMAGRRELNTKYDAMLTAIESAAKLPPSQRLAIQAWNNPFPEEQSSLGKLRYAPIAVMVPAFQKSVEAFDRARLKHQSITLLLHLERHRLAQGSYPETLASLTGIPIPTDYFTDKPIRYRLINKDSELRPVLYSVGLDRTDDQAARPFRERVEPELFNFKPLTQIAWQDQKSRSENRGDAILADPFQAAPRLTQEQASADFTPPN
jgi:hypothetical protein